MYWNDAGVVSGLGSIKININMRCIEIIYDMSGMSLYGININMRCIEIIFGNLTIWGGARLTLTWDVLKYFHQYEYKTSHCD